MKQLFAYLVLGWAFFAQPAQAVNVGEPLEFESEEQKALYNTMLHELRCTVCQNQSLAESNANLAADLRGYLYDMVKADADKEMIQKFMVDRYGEFVLYRPQFTPANYLLWIGPFVLLLIGVIVMRMNIHARNKLQQKQDALTQEEEARLQALLQADKEKQ